MAAQRLTILGGSTPFTCVLLDALRAKTAQLPVTHVVLFGRNEEKLFLVGGYGRRQFSGTGWRFSETADIAEALDGATVVIHQIRYGGLERRILCEDFCGENGTIPDETLGPGALIAAIAMGDELRTTITSLRRHSPDAWVLNLTNPLSIVTAQMIAGGLPRCVGVCELPLVTAMDLAEHFGVRLKSLQWSYVGLNHRGFIYRARCENRDFIAELASSSGETSVSGIFASDVRALGALPLKYFRVATGREGPISSGRGRFVGRVAEELIDDLRATGSVKAETIAKRDPVWYRLAVVPVICSLMSDKPTAHILNIAGRGGVVREARALVSCAGVVPSPESELPEAVGMWMRAFREHERLVLRAVLHPSPETVSAALAADPSLGGGDHEELSRSVWKTLSGIREQTSPGP